MFPSHPLERSRVDPDFATEYETAQLSGFGVMLYDDDALRAGDMVTALRQASNYQLYDPQEVILRGYMLDYLRYKTLYKGLETHNLLLVNNPVEYGKAHYWSAAYKHFKNVAVESFFFPGKDLTHENALRFCESGAWFMKDYVKSAKEKGIIKDIQDKADFERAKTDLLEARGKQFYDGFALKRYHELSTYTVLGKPQPLEVRFFFYKGHMVSAAMTHGGDAAFSVAKQFAPSWLPDLVRNFKSNFFTVDIGWQGRVPYVLETGDGQVSGLSPDQHSLWFYNELKMIALQS